MFILHVSTYRCTSFFLTDCTKFLIWSYQNLFVHYLFYTHLGSFWFSFPLISMLLHECLCNLCLWTCLKYVEGRILEFSLLVPRICMFYILIDITKCPPENGFANSYSVREGVRDQLLYVHAKTEPHQSFKFCQSLGWFFFLPFNLQGHILFPPPASLRLLAADSQRQSAGGKMRSRPKAYFLSVGRVFTWANTACVMCLFGLKGKETRPIVVSQAWCSNALIDAS